MAKVRLTVVRWDESIRNVLVGETIRIAQHISLRTLLPVPARIALSSGGFLSLDEASQAAEELQVAMKVALAMTQSGMETWKSIPLSPGKQTFTLVGWEMETEG